LTDRQVVLTEAGLKKIDDELRHLQTVRRQEVADVRLPVEIPHALYDALQLLERGGVPVGGEVTGLLLNLLGATVRPRGCSYTSPTSKSSKNRPRQPSLTAIRLLNLLRLERKTSSPWVRP